MKKKIKQNETTSLSGSEMAKILGGMDPNKVRQGFPPPIPEPVATDVIDVIEELNAPD